MKFFFLIRVFIVVHRRLLFATLGRLVGILQTLTSKLYAYYENRYKNWRAIFISINSCIYISHYAIINCVQCIFAPIALRFVVWFFHFFTFMYRFIFILARFSLFGCVFVCLLKSIYSFFFALIPF